MNNNKTLTRRNFAALGTVAALGLAAEAKTDRNAPETDIVYKPATPSKAADYAYKLYSDGGCMYATVKSILTMCAAKPVPMHYDMFKYGHGGCGGQGSLCGACNGTAAAIAFFVKDKKECDALVAKVFRWYETTQLPLYGTAIGGKDNVTSTSDSTLCHVSMTKWCKTAGKSPISAERKDRCARLTADTTQKTVELLNEHFSGSKTTEVPSEKQTSCTKCHTVNTQPENLSEVPKVKVKMSCNTCHADPHRHPKLPVTMPEHQSR